MSKSGKKSLYRSAPVFFGDLIKSHRERNHLSQSTLGDMTGFSQSTISKMEIGNSELPHLAKLQGLRRVLGIGNRYFKAAYIRTIAERRGVHLLGNNLAQVVEVSHPENHYSLRQDLMDRTKTRTRKMIEEMAADTRKLLGAESDVEPLLLSQFLPNGSRPSKALGKILGKKITVQEGDSRWATDVRYNGGRYIITLESEVIKGVRLQDPDARYAFAHAIAHARVHQWELRHQDDSFFFDEFAVPLGPEDDGMFMHLARTNQTSNLEHQADIFAAALLAPPTVHYSQIMNPNIAMDRWSTIAFASELYLVPYRLAEVLLINAHARLMVEQATRDLKDDVKALKMQLECKSRTLTALQERDLSRDDELKTIADAQKPHEHQPEEPTW